MRQYDPEVLKRLPYWVREVLRMMGEIEAGREEAKSGSGARNEPVDADSQAHFLD